MPYKIEPEDKTSFGHLLWLMIGGHTANRDRESKLLGLRLYSNELSRIMHGHHKPSENFIKKKKWRQVFRKYHPEEWDLYKECFEIKVSQLNRWGSKKEIEISFRRAVSGTIKRFINKTGSNADFLESRTATAAVKGSWPQILNADPALDECVFALAIDELCTIYDIKISNRRRYRRLQKLKQMNAQLSIAA